MVYVDHDAHVVCFVCMFALCVYADSWVAYGVDQFGLFVGQVAYGVIDCGVARRLYDIDQDVFQLVYMVAAWLCYAG